MVGKPGTLVKLNGLLDDCASITLADGEIVRRNPDTIIVLTTNTDYKGCKDMNESILSRMCMVFDKKELTPEQMKKRVMVKTGCKDEVILLKMAETVEKSGSIAGMNGYAAVCAGIGSMSPGFGHTW